MTKYLKNAELLNESYRNEDYFDFKTHAKNLSINLSTSKSPTVTVVIGGYGSGKSVLLNEVHKIATDKTKWVFFECWQYPDKTDLWEALILDVVEEISGKKSREKLSRAYSDRTNWRDNVSAYLSDIKTALATFLGLTIVSWLVISYADDATKNVLTATLISFITILFASTELLAKQESKSNISRLNDYKAELENTVKKSTSPLYIVLEDVDRAGELGRQFFETVSHFIKSTELRHKDIKIIVPVASISGSEVKGLQDSIDKAADNIINFEPKFNTDVFISEIFSTSFLDEPTKALLSTTINPMIGKGTSVRKLKQILRNSIAKHERLIKSGTDSLLPICIAVELSKYMPHQHGGTLFLRRDNFRHKPLMEWVKSKGLLDDSNDDEKKIVELHNFFGTSSDIFADIRYQDNPTGSFRASDVQIYKRQFLLSEAYFNDI